MDMNESAGGRRLKIAADPARSRTLPGWAYTDPQLYALEGEKILARTWHYAGALDELKQPGDYVTGKILNESVIVIRGKDETIRGFYNVCQHRAHELLRGRGQAKVITCPYHAWSYHADGRLRTARGAEKLIEFAPEEFALRPVRTEVFAGRFVFFNLDPDARPLAEQAGDLAAELQEEIVAFDRLELRRETWSGSMNANWKVAVDNYLECYHCRPAHPAFADLVDMDSYRIATKPYWSSQKGGRGRLDNRAYPLRPNEANQKALFWWLWPTTTFNVLPGQAAMSVFTFLPTAPATTLQWGQVFTLPGEDIDPARIAYGNQVLGPEDVALCESVQRGLSSRGYDTGRFIHDPAGGEDTEEAVHHFHRLVAEELGLNAG